jgi:hypothetical protein
MAGSLEEWERYERWNRAIAEVVFSPAIAGQPVYLDLEDDVLEIVGKLADPDAEDQKHDLIEAVKGTLVFRHGVSHVFAGHVRKLEGWHRGSMLDPPPTLGLLALLSLTAENMRQSDDMRAHNFYGRFGELVGLTKEQLNWFETAYRYRRQKEAASAELWGSLNDWLEMNEGGRGLPTAFPIGHDHIGLPLSQALVRQADRDKFADLFFSQGLPAGSSLPTSEMSERIDEWMSRIPCPATNTLERLWRDHPATRVPIAEVARLTLETWDGTLPEGTLRQVAQREIDTVRLQAIFRTFPERRIDVSMVMPGRAISDFETVEVLDVQEHQVETIVMVPIASGWLGVSDDCAIDVETFLNGDVRLRRAGHSEVLRRRPRRLIPLRRDDLLSAFVECERVQLGEEALIFSRIEIAPQVAAFLDRVARPGYGQSTSLQGVPTGWVLFQGVQILLSGERDPLVDLNVLQPLARSQVVLEGGLKLPGHLRKWLTDRPPELRASLYDGSEPEATITCTRAFTNPAPSDLSHSGAGSVLIWNIADTDLPDGDFQITVIADGEEVGREMLRLRSADNPALEIDPEATPIVHDPLETEFGFFAGRSRSQSAFAGVPDSLGTIDELEAPSIPGWWSARATAAKSGAGVRTISFPRDGPSCAETGAHYMDIETAVRGQSSIEGICRICGLIKRYPTRPRLRRAQQAKTSLEGPAVRLSELPVVRSEGQIDWSVAFDAICHTGGGPFSAFDRIASQMEATDLFGDALSRKLDVLGHIEIERNRATLAGTSWRVNDPIVLGFGSGDAAVIGFRNDTVLVAIEDEAWASGWDTDIKEQTGAPPLLTVALPDHECGLRLAKVIAAAAKRPARYVPNAAINLAAQLPKLSRVRNCLPSISTLSARSYERWDPTTARFHPTTDASAPGAIRLNGHTRSYVYRRDEDLGMMRASLGDARIVKYLAALDSQLSLVGYDSATKILYVPLGADLPGLYGRAAVLASGRPPLENTEERILEYRKVPASLAAHLTQLLMS